MKQKIKLNFSDFWSNFDKTNNYFYNLLSAEFEIEISEAPDFLIYSVFGTDYLDYKCIRIFFTGESVRPDFTECDYAFTFDYSKDPRNYRLPLFVLSTDLKNFLRPKQDPKEVIKSKTKFCNFIYRNNKAKERINFFQMLNSKYKKVDAAGALLNNMGGRTAGEDKIQFIKDYKFTIAFENSSYPGYTTEKLIDPMIAKSIPIYWGNPLVHLDFNTKSFINCHEYKNFEEVINRIIEIDQDDRIYMQYLSEPYFKSNIIPENLREESVLNQFKQIMANKEKIKPVSNSWKKYFSYLNIAKRKIKKVKYKYFTS